MPIQSSLSVGQHPALSPDPCDLDPEDCYYCDPDFYDCYGNGDPGGGEGGGGGSLPTTPTVTVSSASGVYGQAIDRVTAIVSGPGGGIPTGTIDFSVNIASIPDHDVDLDDSGKAVWNFEELGSYPVVSPGSYYTFAEYGGDDDYLLATGEGTLAIEKAYVTSEITNCPSSSIASGQSLSFKVNVTWLDPPVDPVSEIAAPTGQIILYNYVSSSGSSQTSGTLSPGYAGSASTATIQITLTGIGVHTFSVGYEGDSNYNSSTEESCSITVQ